MAYNRIYVHLLSSCTIVGLFAIISVMAIIHKQVGALPWKTPARFAHLNSSLFYVREVKACIYDKRC